MKPGPKSGSGRQQNNALFGEALRCLRQLAGPDHMPSHSLPADTKNQQQHHHSSSCDSKHHHAGCSFLAASAISLLGMTLLAAALLVHFLLLTSVARNGEFFLLPPPSECFFCLSASLSAPDPHAPWGNELRCAWGCETLASGPKRLLGLALDR